MLTNISKSLIILYAHFAIFIPLSLLVGYFTDPIDGLYIASLILFLSGLFISIFRKTSFESKRIINILNIDPYKDDIEQILYTNGQDEIRFIKGLQWNLIYYILLVFGAFYAILETISILPIKLYILVSFIVFIFNCCMFNLGIFFIIEIQYKLRECRIQLDKTKYYRIGYYENGVFNKQRYEKEMCDDLHFWRDPRILITLLIAISVAYIIIIFKSYPNLREHLIQIFKLNT